MRVKYYFDIEITEKNTLKIGNKEFIPSIRKISDLSPVLMNPIQSENPAYFMYRNIYLDEHKDLFERNRIRFDITILLPLIIGKEYNKTFGHYHPKSNGFSYPEIYEVIKGRAIFILQSETFDRVFLIYAKEGDQVFIFPNYGHVTVNIGNEPLILSNLVYSDFQSDYSVYREKRGAMVYVTTEGFIKNPNYNTNFEIVELRAKKLFRELYLEYIEHPEDFNFLKGMNIK